MSAFELLNINKAIFCPCWAALRDHRKKGSPCIHTHKEAYMHGSWWHLGSVLTIVSCLLDSLYINSFLPEMTIELFYTDSNPISLSLRRYSLFMLYTKLHLRD